MPPHMGGALPPWPPPASREVSQPRALCALSEDRQWLVVLAPEPWAGQTKLHWHVVHWESSEDGFWEQDHFWEDRGQDAHEVLRAFLEGREKYV